MTMRRRGRREEKQEDWRKRTKKRGERESLHFHLKLNKSSDWFEKGRFL